MANNQINIDNILKEYDEQFAEMQNEIVNILEKILKEKDLKKIKNICQKEIDIIKKDQQIKDFNNVYDMKGRII